MSTIKKQFTIIHDLLLANKNKKLTPKLIESLEELMMSKVMAKTSEVDEDGNVTKVFCYYHKVWEDVKEVEYGKKSSTSTGLNTMCKVGVSRWTKQQRLMKQSKTQLLDDVASGKIEANELPSLINDIEEIAKIIVPLEEVE